MVLFFHLQTPALLHLVCKTTWGEINAFAHGGRGTELAGAGTGQAATATLRLRHMGFGGECGSRPRPAGSSTARYRTGSWPVQQQGKPGSPMTSQDAVSVRCCLARLVTTLANGTGYTLSTLTGISPVTATCPQVRSGAGASGQDSPRRER